MEVTDKIIDVSFHDKPTRVDLNSDGEIISIWYVQGECQSLITDFMHPDYFVEIKKLCHESDSIHG